MCEFTVVLNEIYIPFCNKAWKEKCGLVYMERNVLSSLQQSTNVDDLILQNTKNKNNLFYLLLDL